jgi:hypothetical protein
MGEPKVDDPPRGGGVIEDNTKIALLGAREYLARLQGAQSAMQRSLLVLIGLIAFWLAIENIYQRYNDLHEGRALQNLLSYQINSDQNDLGKIEKRAPNLSAEDTVDKENLEDRIERAKGKIEEISKDAKDLRRQSVNLSLASTALPSTLSFAPSFWLLTLFCWILYFTNRRASAHRNLAALLCSIKPQDRAFGVAGEGSVWLAPLPKSVQIETGAENGNVVDHRDILYALGWDRLTERNYRMIVFALTAGTLTLTGRVLFLALQFTSAFAVDQKLVGASWRMPGTIVSVLLGCLCMMTVITLLARASGGGDSDPLRRSRRMFVSGGVGVGIALMVGLDRDGLAGAWTEWLIAGPKTARRGATSFPYSPRYVTKDKKARRTYNRRVVQPVGFANTLAYSSRPPQDGRTRRTKVALHFADKAGKVRFSSILRGDKYLVQLEDDAAIDWANKGSESTDAFNYLPVAGTGTWVWEAVALARIEEQDSDGACKLLLAAVKVMVDRNIPVWNWRLCDLAAGLAVRSKREDFLAQLIALGDSRKGASARQQNAWDARVKSWQTSEWRKRWTDHTKPVWWHHPTETRTWTGPGSKSLQLASPQIRQRPVRIA